ncbi:hypothetical protein [Zooshikella sp. RANM57]|uniref:hypothetical protein n=1 Tax=Zooshikella sp. RANM57 TaxID=3425863 RepID=UPI003D6EF897
MSANVLEGVMQHQTYLVECIVLPFLGVEEEYKGFTEWYSITTELYNQLSNIRAESFMLLKLTDAAWIGLRPENTDIDNVISEAVRS